VATGLVGATVAGYRIEAAAGRGGMGVVYRARDIALDRVVALKVIAPEYARDSKFRTRFVRESLATAGVDHPNVIPVYDAGEDDDGQLYIAMRFVEGDDLGSLLHEKGALDPALAAELVAQAGAALDAAHARGLVHRDVKPANVLIDGGARPHVYLTDFGLAKWEDSTSGLTSTGGWLGTPDYLAPEQVDGGTPDARTDVYALGCVLFAALTGRPPFADVPKLRKATAHLHEPPPSLKRVAPEVPTAFDPVLWRALAKEPARRYASAGELGTAALAAASGAAEPTTARTRRMRPKSAPAAPTAKLASAPKERRWRAARIAGALVGLAIAGVAAAALLGAFSPNTRHPTPDTQRSTTPAPTAAAGTVRCTANLCTQAGRRVQAPIEDGTCGAGIGTWSRIDAGDPPLIACVPHDAPVNPPRTITVPDVLGGRLDRVHHYLDNLGIKHDTSGGGLLGILDDSAWMVCASSPAAGARVTPDQTVKLFAERSC
jgi:hypothetical protein